MRVIVARAEPVGITRGGALSHEEWRERTADLFVDCAARTSEQRQQLERVREAIEAGLLTNTATTVVMTLCSSRMHFVDVVFGCDQRS
ncbi:MAG: hypothetical protein JOZ75_06630 [Candidatus Dormibacteraeota bacterium]|nr:hypothetical protein [Candidatus Dormibacteraeota bacterium]